MKILILTKDYPPLNSIAAQRPAAWFNYFNDQGHDTWVITSTNSRGALDEGRIIRVGTDLNEVKKGTTLLIRKLRSFFEIWLPFVLPISSRFFGIYLAAEKAIQSQKPDIIIATGEPFILFKFAQKLSRKRKIPWLADYRDNWSNEPTLELAPFFKKIYSGYFAFFEKRIVRSAALITTVGDPTLKRIKRISPKKRVEIIPNGHTIPSHFKNKVIKRNTLKISYIGRLYKHRNPSLFLNGLLKWKNDNPDLKIELHFYGLGDFHHQEDYLLSLVPEVNNLIFIHKSFPYFDMLNHVSDSNAFLMLADKSLPLTNGKLYDYLGLKRPIILCPDDHSIFRNLVLNGECGYLADSEKDVVQILNTFYQHIGDDDFFKIDIPRNEYSRIKSSHKLLDLIQELCAES